MVILEEWLHFSYVFISTERADSQPVLPNATRSRCIYSVQFVLKELIRGTEPSIFLGRLLHQTSIWQICSSVKLSILQPLGMNLRIRSSRPDNSENSEPLSVVIVLKTSSQCSSYWDLTSRNASMTPFGSRPGMRSI